MNKITKILSAVGLVVALILSYAAYSKPATVVVKEVPVAGDISINNQDFPNGIKNGSQNTMWETVSIGPGVNKAFWKNTNGRAVILDYAEMITSGVASSTYKFYVATSTGTYTTDYTAPLPSTGLLIQGASVATSSVAKVVTSAASSTGATAGAIRVLDGEYLMFTFQQPGPACNGATCETSTSTNRGFNVTGNLKYHY